VYLAGEYCEGYFFTVPAMEKAAESAKFAVAQFYRDTGNKYVLGGMNVGDVVDFIPPSPRGSNSRTSTPSRRRRRTRVLALAAVAVIAIVALLRRGV
jgi:hypothetical protein